ncbi:hypothetical protein ACQUSR_05575 [Streptomyces sp. P1-3]|uniref:hypothetical protein n=1 Tax=Streptomyces sp. P1-3 TaxID=3421658 RepID=UPI003D363832
MVERTYWICHEREDAEDAGSDLVDALRRLDIEFDNIEIVSPCSGCQRSDHRIDLGQITVQEARDAGLKIKQVLDELAKYRKRQASTTG